MEKKYVISFLISFLTLALIIFTFVTWANPNRVTPMPWSIEFTADRNMAFKKFSLIKGNTAYTDLIVGSSTSEVFVPQMIEELYGVKSFLGGTGGAKTAYRLAQINYAIKNNPNLKRVIYVVDLFEFQGSGLDTHSYYQPAIMDEVPKVIRAQIPSPDITSRIQDFFSEAAISSSFKTLKDYRKFKKGQYQSQFKNDGTTEKSMVVVDHKEDIEPRVLRIARAYEPTYKNLTQLDPVVIETFKEVARTAESQNIEIYFIITPWHSLFYEHFKDDLKRNNIYSQWIEFIKGLSHTNIKVIDFSYPYSKEKGIGDKKEFWHDGVHFSHKSAEIILNEIYRAK